MSNKNIILIKEQNVNDAGVYKDEYLQTYENNDSLNDSQNGTSFFTYWNDNQNLE